MVIAGDYVNLIQRVIAPQKNFGSGVLNPGAVFLRFVTVVFLIFLEFPNLSKATLKIRRNPTPGFNIFIPNFLLFLCANPAAIRNKRLNN